MEALFPVKENMGRGLGADLTVGVARDHADDPEIGRITEENLRETTSDHRVVASTEDRLGGLLAGATAAEVITADDDRGLSEAVIVEVVFFILARLGLTHVVEEILTQSVEGDALHEACGDDAVGVDIVAGHENALSGDLFNRCGWHF